MSFSEMLSLFGRYCPQLKSLSYPCNVQHNVDKVLSFFCQYGGQLETLDLSESIDNTIITTILQLCPIINKVKLPPNYNLISNDKEFLPKLEKIGNKLEINSDNINKITILSDKYSQTLRRKWYNDISEIPISDRFFDVFTHFKSIKKLTIDLEHNPLLSGSIECFKHCERLTELDIKYPELIEDFFATIDSFVPKLQLIAIRTRNQFSNSFINLFQSMKCIEKVEIRYESNNVMVIYYFGKCLSDVMSSPNRKDVKRVNHNCGLLLSNDLF